ncbi:hypothetical protein N7454_004442 [Penicillium verhagenii]|nr:hypothetical protein N7454_004442 [Penicillium verhagenii]
MVDGSPDLDFPVSSALSASSSLSPTNTRNLRAESRLAPAVFLSSPSGDESSSSSAGSPSQSVTLDPPSLPFRSATLRPTDSQTSSPDNRRAESSVYYTTAWGSPYAAPSTRRLSLTLSQYAGIDNGASRDSSPTPSINPPELRRASVAVNSEDLAGHRGGKSIRDFTQDWINQYLSGQPRTAERSNWLSDDSGSEAPSFFTAKNHLADDLSDDWLGLEEDNRESELLKTPTLSDFVGKKTSARGKSKKNSHKRTETLRQEDFWGFAYDKELPNITMSEHNDNQPPAVEVTSPNEKPLPPPPTTTNDEFSTPEYAERSGGPDVSNKEAEISTPTIEIPQRRRKKIVWKGKACVIDIPVDDPRGTEASGQHIMKPEEVEARLKQWEEQGYDVRGFTIGDVHDTAEPTELGSLTRPLYPDPAETHEEGKAQPAFIRFPDKAVWDSYVAHLQEEKLRALGVSFGDDEPGPSISPASGSMNHSQTPFPGLVASPPIPSASSASNPLGGIHPFSPQFGQSTGAGGIGSLASPASQFSVQTPFMGMNGMDQNMISGFPFQYQPTPPAQGAMTPQSLINIRQANGSVGPGGLQNFTSMMSPVSPMHDQVPFHSAFNDGFQEKEMYNGRFGNEIYEDGPPFPTPQTPVNDPSQFHASNVEIAHPTPRGHGHNLSETLQRGLENMTQPEYHLNHPIEHSMETDEHDASHHDLNANILKSRWALPENHAHHQVQNGPSQAAHSFAQHPHQFYNEQYAHDNAHEGSDFDTNPSITGTPQTRGAQPNQGSWHEAKPSAGSFRGHHSRLSTSSFNVEAKEFDPTASFGSQSAPFVNPAFQFGGVEQPGYGFAPATSFPPPGIKNAPINPNPNPEPKPKSSFKFSAASFNVDAPVFNPSASITSNHTAKQPSESRAKIFGDIDISEMPKGSKESKAVPIVRPDDEVEPKEEDDEQWTHDGLEGRPVPTDRHKRARRAVGHAEGEARYSISTHPLGESGNAQASNTLQNVAEGKENSFPGDIDNFSHKRTERDGTPDSEADTWTLFDAQRDADAGSHSATPGPEEQSKDATESIEETGLEQSGDAPKAHSSQESQDKNMLSATARPFEFKPAVSSFSPSGIKPPNFGEQSPSMRKSEHQQDEKKKSGLMASRFAAASPPKSHPPPISQTIAPFQEPENLTAQQKLEYYRESADESPDDDELNAIMEQLNDDSDVGIERQATPLPLTTPLPRQYISESVGGPTKERPFGSAEGRSEAPSPSPGGGHKSYRLDIPKLASDIDAQSTGTFSPVKSLISRIQSPVRQLITENDHVSDWDDMISSGEDEKFFNRNRFFDRRINDIVGSAIEDRLSPMERALAVIQQSVASLATGAATRRVLSSNSAELEDSDADDEDDGEEARETSSRDRSPHHMRDRKVEMLKSIVMEALVTHDMPHRSAPHSSHSEMALLKESIAELQALTIKKLAQDPVGDMREILEETLARQLAQQTPRLSEAEEIGADSLMLQIDGLKSMLRLADERSEQEFRARREAQESIGQLQSLLKLAEEDAARHSAAAEDAEARFLYFKEEKIPHLEKMQFRSESLAEENETLKVTLAELSSKNIALEGTLDEYRVTSDHFRRQLETTKDENKSLHETVDHLRTRIEDSMHARQNLTEKFDRLQNDMVTVTSEVVQDQAAARRREEDQTAKHNELRAAHAREIKLREQLEQDVREFEVREREAAKIKFVHEQSLQENSRLEEIIAKLRAENQDLQLKSARFEREFNDARESGIIEVQRTRTSMEADIEAANSQVNIVRAELEAQIIRLQSQVDHISMNADTARERYEMLLEDANDSKVTAMSIAKESRETALEDQRKTHERVLNDLRERHARALHNSSEDRQRGEAHTEERLALAGEKVIHLQDRVQHLEEKLEIAQSAARAAAEAAQKAGSAPIPVPAPAPVHAHSSSPSMSFNKGSNEPDKISPQALRESIFVLQDQLQQRETRIEELEQEVASVDKDAPNKIKERDSEITWLREVLGVRIDDLQDIIKTLSQPSFNQHAVRDAAIRLKANLQMQQQERERAMSGPALPSLQSIAASPRSLPLAAAAAWGNWRKGRENANGGNSPSDQTPSKSSNASAFLSGLLTPPSSHVRQNAPHASAPVRSYAETRPLRGFSSPRRDSVRSEASIPEPPKTPPLLRRSSYDHDAEPANYEGDSFATDDIESTIGGMVSASPKETGEEGPFGPQITSDTEEGSDETED